MDCEIVNRIKGRLTADSAPATVTLASEDAITEAEVTLGFKVPPLLRLIYANIANGGFGPGYGIIGVKGGHRSDLGTLAETYDQVIRGAQYLGFQWKTGLLPFCGWGCNMFSCVDCDDAAYRVSQSEECKTRVQPYTLEEFFNMWLDGVDILGISRLPGTSVEVINPFNRKKMRVARRRD